MTKKSLDQSPFHYLMPLMGLITGFMLYGLSLLYKQWLGKDLVIVLGMFMVAFSSSVLLLSPVTDSPKALSQLKKTVIFAGILSLLLALSQYWVLSSYLSTVNRVSIIFSWHFTLALVFFVSLGFIQSYLSDAKQLFSFNLLLNNTWNLSSLLLIQSLFSLIVTLCLVMIYGLLKLAGIKAVFLTEIWFSLPMSGLVFAVGVQIGKKNPSITHAITQLIRTFFYIKLPFGAAFCVVLLGLLALNGLDILWRTGYASTILLSLIIIVFVATKSTLNTDGNGKTPPKITRLLTNIALLTLPIYSAITAYNVYLRIDQYGWTPNRIWLSFIVLLVGVYSILFAWASIKDFRHKSQGQWLSLIPKWSPHLILIGAILVWLMNLSTGMIHYVSAQSQVKRFLASQIPIEQNDLNDLKYEMGKQGNLAYLKFINDAKASNNPKLKKIKEETERPSDNELDARIKANPYEHISLIDGLDSISREDLIRLRLQEEHPNWYCNQEVPCKLSVKKLNKQNPNEKFYVVIRFNTSHNYVQVFKINSVSKEFMPVSIHEPQLIDAETEALTVETVEPQFSNLKVGNKLIQINVSAQADQ